MPPTACLNILSIGWICGRSVCVSAADRLHAKGLYQIYHFVMWRIGVEFGGRWGHLVQVLYGPWPEKVMSIYRMKESEFPVGSFIRLSLSPRTNTHIQNPCHCDPHYRVYVALQSFRLEKRRWTSSPLRLLFTLRRSFQGSICLWSFYILAVDFNFLIW